MCASHRQMTSSLCMGMDAKRWDGRGGLYSYTVRPTVGVQSRFCPKCRKELEYGLRSLLGPGGAHQLPGGAPVAAAPVRDRRTVRHGGRMGPALCRAANLPRHTTAQRRGGLGGVPTPYPVQTTVFQLDAGGAAWQIHHPCAVLRCLPHHWYGYCYRMLGYYGDMMGLQRSSNRK